MTEQALEPLLRQVALGDSNAFKTLHDDEIATVLESLLADRPHVGGINLDLSAEKLSGRPMSDIAWAVNESARIAVKSQKDAIDDICLFQAISRLPR